VRASRETRQVADQTACRRLLVREIDQSTGGRLELAGRRYKLVADCDLANVPGRDQYEVLNRDLAGRLLDGLAASPGTSPELIRLLGQAREQLTRDWRRPFSEPDGLILLRRIPVPRRSAVAHEPAITPSQLKALAEAGWIEIEFVDSLGQPIAASCRLELPDCTPVATGDDGQKLVARHGFVPGLCRVSLPKLDAAVWRLAS